MNRTRTKIYITRWLPVEVTARLQDAFDCKWWDREDVPVPRDVLLQEVKEVDGLLCMVTDPIDSELLDTAPRLRVVSNMAVGYDNIQVEEAKKRNVIVCNTPDVLTETTADLTFALLLATSRRLMESASFLKNDEWQSWSPFLLAGLDVHHKTLGIIGLGRIGQAVARRAIGFGMRVLYHNRNRRLEEEQSLGVEYRDLETLLQESDFVSVLTPLTKDTYHLIGESELSLMKSTAVLINTSRGPVVDEEALYEALKKKRIWAAGLDVFDHEPVRASHPLIHLPNVMALPHIGSATVETRLAMANLAVENLMLVLAGKSPKYRVC